MNNQTCQFPGCRETETTECRLTHQKGEMPFSYYLLGGLGGLLLWLAIRRQGTADELFYFCPEHCLALAFCYGCGRFQPPIWENDPELFGAGLCLSCWGKVRPVDEMLRAAAAGCLIVPFWEEGRLTAEVDMDLESFEDFVKSLDFSGLDDFDDPPEGIW